jgi:hypothetical protein
MRDPIVGVASKATPEAWRLGAPESRQLGACLLTPEPWLAS